MLTNYTKRRDKRLNKKLSILFSKVIVVNIIIININTGGSINGIETYDSYLSLSSSSPLIWESSEVTNLYIYIDWLISKEYFSSVINQTIKELFTRKG